MTNQTLFHTVRDELEQEQMYFWTLQELGNLTDDIYFGSAEHDDCEISVGNECNRFVRVPTYFRGFENGYDI